MVITNQAGEKIIYPDIKIEPVAISIRLKKTAMAFLKSAALTVLFVFVPVLHFILVPIGIFITLVGSWLAWKRTYYFDQLEVHCPTCDKKSVTAISSSDLPLRTFCPHCRNMLYLQN